MKIHHILFLDSVSYTPMPLRKLPEAFGLAASKLWYPHYFNTKANLDYVGPIPDIEYSGANEMGRQRGGNLWTGMTSTKSRYSTTGTCWNNTAKMTPYCDRRVVYCREFLEIGNVEVFLEALTIASACNKVLSKKFLKPETIGLIPPGG